MERSDLVALRRELHRHPEPAWREFYTTARVVAAARDAGADEVFVGEEAVDPDARRGVPGASELATWRERALDAGADPDLVAAMGEGNTGAVAVLRRGAGPTVALRVDIDALPREESDCPDHRPATEGFRSETPAMHACGHDAHATIGVGVLAALAEDPAFEGTLKVFFQPAEETIAGANAMAATDHLDDVDALLALHVGLDHPTGEVVAGVEEFLAVRQFRAEFAGEPAHAGGHPDRGRDAVKAMAAAVTNLHAIPRHGDGATRVNAGRVGGGTATNIVPESAFVEGEVRGGTTELMEYTWEAAERVLGAAADMHDCELALERRGDAPSAQNHPEAVDAVETAARDAGADSVLRHAPLGGSEDATVLMNAVAERGGRAAYVCIGTDHPGDHHTATFDVDEESLALGVDVLSRALRALAA